MKSSVDSSSNDGDGSDNNDNNAFVLISERLSQFTNELGEKQTCNVEMRHLYKRIYFNPGLGPPPAPSSQETAEEESMQ